MMEIVFKDDNFAYKKDIILLKTDIRFIRRSISNIPHLDDVKILYHYKDIISGEIYPVYYEYNGRFTSKEYGKYHVYLIGNKYIRDNTLTNLNLLD